MSIVQFTERDAELLYSFPKPPANLKTVVWVFTFINRTAPPTYDELAGCLARAVKVGIIREEHGWFVVEENWYDKIHAADRTAENEIESMLTFEDWFVGAEFVEVNKTSYLLTTDEFARIGEATK